MSSKQPPDSTDSVFSRRAVVLGALQLGGFGILFSRLYHLQITSADEYATLSDENRINYRLIQPLRGRIYDRFGNMVASNRANLKVTVVPEDAGDLEQVLDAVSLIAPLEPEERARVLRRARRQRAFVPVTVKEHLSWAQFARLNVEGLSLPGIVPEASSLREYHFGPELAHIVGYVGEVSEWDVDDERLLHMPGFEVGKNGVERSYDHQVRGLPGVRRVEINAGGRVIREIDRTPPDHGEDLVLSTDLELQRFAQERLEGETGAAVVMDVHTGEVLVSASVPGFDSSQFSGGISQQNWSALMTDPDKPMLNRALVGQYPPGSTFKMVVALAALENDIIAPTETVRCTGRYHLGSHSYGCWKHSGHGRVNMHDALQRSCDYYFYEVASRVGIDRIAEMANKLGLGLLEDVDYEDAKAGVIPTIGWKISTMGEPWYPGETLIAGIGQGYVLSTPLQLCVYAARIANGVHAVQPRLARSIGGQSTITDPWPELGIAPESIAYVQNAMNSVVNRGGGTAHASRIDVDGMLMAGKTGTSQVRSLAAEHAARARGEEIERRFRDHALFVAFAPVDEPRYAISVIVEHGGGGSRAAAPVAKDIMIKVLERDPARQTAFVPDTQEARRLVPEEGSDHG
jgi:penicillin-binding protein 2